MQGLMLLVIILLSGNGFAQEVCVPVSEFNQIIVEVEQGRICNKAIEAYESGAKLYEEKITILEQKNQNTEVKFNECEKTLKVQTELQNTKYNACKDDLDKVAGEKRKAYLIGGGVGAGLVAILALIAMIL